MPESCCICWEFGGETVFFSTVQLTSVPRTSEAYMLFVLVRCNLYDAPCFLANIHHFAFVPWNCLGDCWSVIAPVEIPLRKIRGIWSSL